MNIPRTSHRLNRGEIPSPAAQYEFIHYCSLEALHRYSQLANAPAGGFKTLVNCPHNIIVLLALPEQRSSNHCNLQNSYCCASEVNSGVLVYV